MRYFTIILLILAIFGLLFFLNKQKDVLPSGVVETPMTDEIKIVRQNLHVPWSTAFLPNGVMMVTERDGSLHIGEERLIVEGVNEVGEGGLLGLAIHPDFENNNFVYLYFTTRQNNQTINRVSRYVLENSKLTLEKIIIDNIPGGSVHNGGRIHFGPDKMLYVTTGDSGKSSLAQDTNSLAGKILRLEADGSIPKDNPFENAVYSYGHRNPQGLAWGSFGDLWETEHGRSGLQSGLDEINLIEKGANYGWPVIEGDEEKEGMKNPILHSGSATWAPSGIDFYNGKLYFAGLRGKALYEVSIVDKGELGELKINFKDFFGRLRGVSVHEGYIYLTTSNKDGRGSARENDDKVIRILLGSF